MKNQLLKISFLIISLFYITPAFALPVDGVVTAGSASINQTTSQSLLIQQGTDQAIINWQQFNIAQGEHVMIQQPGASSVLLNRVIGNDPSSIFGQLTANGKIFLSNPNGVYFSPSARVDVGSLLATTFQISNTDFMSGNLQFNRTQTPSAVINEGSIKVMDNGFVVLVGSGVLNEGQILANLGTVWLASGERASIDFSGDGLMKYQIVGNLLSSVSGLDGKPFSSAVNNTGLIQANGGQVILSARTTASVFSSVINQSGVIEAKSLVNRGGIIRLEGGAPVPNLGLVGKDYHLGSVTDVSGVVVHSGRLDVSGQGDGASGGEVTLVGQKVLISGAIDAEGSEAKVLVASSDLTVMTGNIDTSGIGNSNGGMAVLWSDRDTIFTGSLFSRGGPNGKGGDVEISGYERLSFNGHVDLEGTAGNGTLLLDPRSIRIVASGGANNIEILDGSILSTEGAGLDWTISANSIPTTGNLSFQATDLIRVEANFSHSGGNIIFGDMSTPNLVVDIGAVVDNPFGDVRIVAPSGIHFSLGGRINSDNLSLDSSPSGRITTANGNLRDIFSVTLNLAAGEGIGANDPLNVSISTLSGATTVRGDIDIEMEGLCDLKSGNDHDFNAIRGGAVFEATGGGNIRISALAGPLVILNGVTFNTTGAVSLNGYNTSNQADLNRFLGATSIPGVNTVIIDDRFTTAHSAQLLTNPGGIVNVNLPADVVVNNNIFRDADNSLPAILPVGLTRPAQIAPDVCVKVPFLPPPPPPPSLPPPPQPPSPPKVSRPTKRPVPEISPTIVSKIRVEIPLNDPSVVANSHEPLAPAPPPCVPLADIHFTRNGGISVEKTDEALLEQHAKWLRDNPSAHVVIGGHADRHGKKSWNMILSGRRAESIEAYFISQGVHPLQLSVIAYGDTDLACTKGPKCCPKNRRATFVCSTMDSPISKQEVARK